MKALLVFCEGRHDVVFAQRSLGAHGGCEWVDKLIGDLPSPFGRSTVARKGLIAGQFEQHALENLSLRDAAHPPLPCFESIVQNTATDTMFFMVRAFGQDQSDPILDLLQVLDVTIADEPVGTFDVSEYAVAFLFDANGEGVTLTLARFRERYGEHFGGLGNLEHSGWVADTTVPIGCFVFHRGAEDQEGTLEDHLVPMVRETWPARYEGAERFVDEQGIQQRGGAAEGNYHGYGAVRSPGRADVEHHRPNGPAARAIRSIFAERGARGFLDADSVEQLTPSESEAVRFVA